MVVERAAVARAVVVRVVGGMVGMVVAKAAVVRVAD